MLNIAAIATAAIGAASGDSLLMIGALLGHKDTKTTARHAHLSDNPIKQAADRIAGVIAEAMGDDEKNKSCQT